MSTMKVTLIGLNKFLHDQDDDLFKNLNVPEGIEKDTLTDNILLRGADFEVMYADPYFMQDAIGLWSRKWQRTFKKWVDALAIEYSPLENYDRIEDYTDTLNRGMMSSARKDSGNTRTFDNQDKRTLDTQDKRTLDTEDEETLNTQNKRTLDTTEEKTLDTQNKRTLDTTEEKTLDTQNKRTLDTTEEKTLDTQNQRTLDTTQTTERTVSAFDSSTYQPAEKTVTENDGTDTMNNTGTETITNTGTDTMDNTGTETVTNTGTDTMDNTGTETITNTGTDTMDNSGTDTFTHSGTDTMDHTGTDTLDHTGTVKDEYGEGTSANETENSKTVHAGRLHGNIGVTTSQQMLESELQIAEWNLYEHITDLFLSEFIIPIYS